MTRAHRQTNRNTLVLNTDLTPLSTWPLSMMSAEDAVHALYRDRVTVVENWEGLFFHSQKIQIPVPKVVALRYYAPIYAQPKFCRRSIFLRDRYRCQYCGARFSTSELTFDHVIPRSRGGTTTWDNILTACVECNALKRDHPAVGDLQPLKQPRRPSATELLRAGLELLPRELEADFGSHLYWNSALVA